METPISPKHKQDSDEHPTCPHCGKITGNETLPNGCVTAHVCCITDISRGCALRGGVEDDGDEHEGEKCPACGEIDHCGIWNCHHCGKPQCECCSCNDMHFRCDAIVNGGSYIGPSPELDL